MEICHVTSVHQSTDIRIFTKECCSLVELGYKVNLIVADGSGSRIASEVNIVDVGMAPRNPFSRFLYVKRDFYKAVLNSDYSIYHLHDPELIPLGVKLRKKNKIVIFDSHEDVPMQILLKKWIPWVFRKPISVLYSIYEKLNLKKYDALVTVNDAILNRLKKINPSAYLITNYPVVKYDWNTPDYFSKNICFAGNIKKEYCHHDILSVVEKNPEITYILAGRDDSDYFTYLTSMKAWKQVVYQGSIPVEAVRKLYENSCVGVAVHEYTPNVGGKTGGLGFIKNFEMMAAGLPIVCTDFEVWKKIIKEEGCGICVEPHNLDQLYNAIDYLLSNPDVAQRMGTNGRNAVLKKYNWETQLVVLSELYNDVLK